MTGKAAFACNLPSGVVRRGFQRHGRVLIVTAANCVTGKTIIFGVTDVSFVFKLRTKGFAKSAIN